MSGTERLGGVELDGFRLVRVLGEGSFGTAYLAEQSGMDRLSVVKIAHRSVIHGPIGSEIRSRFAAEVRAASRILHPGLCTVYTFGETSDHLPAIAMEYIDGETLRARLSRLGGTPMGAEELTNIFTQLATVLEAVHRHGIIHRDITPNNVMLTMDHEGHLQVKLLDFGIAALPQATSGHFVAGTPGYAAPEQLSGAETSVASDLFSFGAVLWWAATGHELFEEIKDLDGLFHVSKNLQTAPDPLNIAPQMQVPLARLVQTLLDPNPAFRPSLEEVCEELDAIRSPGLGAAPRRILMIDTEGLLGPALTPTFTTYGVRVITTNDPRRATRSEGEFGAFLISARLTNPTAAALHHHLSEFQPETPALVIAIGQAAFAWDDVPFQARVRLPGGNYRLLELGEQLREKRRTSRAMRAVVAEPAQTILSPVSLRHRSPAPARSTAFTPSTREVGTASVRAVSTTKPEWVAWTGGMPNLLLDLETAISEGTDISAICENIEELSAAAAVREVHTLAKTLRILTSTGDLEDPATFVADIEAAYTRAVRAQNGLASAPISEVPPTPVRPWSRQ